jgi:ribose-phosphate pyrophosphokinase
MHEIAANITKILREVHHNEVRHLRVEQKEFANGESLPLIPETVRGEYIFLMCGLQNPHPDIAFMRMLRTANALKLASGKGITLVVPYFSYARQDRKAKRREPISARLNADMIETNKSIDRVITSNLHAQQVQGFFSIPVDDLPMIPIQEKHIREHFNNDLSNVTIVTPDLGGDIRAEEMARRLEVPMAIIDKRRQKDGTVKSFAVIGDINGRDCVLIDDIVDQGGTLLNAVTDLKAQGAKSTIVHVTHVILSGQAIERFRASDITIVGTQTIPRNAKFRQENEGWLKFIPIEPMFADAMHQASIVGGSFDKLST